MMGGVSKKLVDEWDEGVQNATVQEWKDERAGEWKDETMQDEWKAGRDEDGWMDPDRSE